MCPPIIEKRPCIYHFLPPSAPPIFWFAHPIFFPMNRIYMGPRNNPHMTHIETHMGLIQWHYRQVTSQTKSDGGNESLYHMFPKTRSASKKNPEQKNENQLNSLQMYF